MFAPNPHFSPTAPIKSIGVNFKGCGICLGREIENKDMLIEEIFLK
jgi:hypothetical protein